jgi:hypothetical protein
MFKIKDFWFNPAWEDALKSADLFDIEAVTQRDFDWFEAPNRRRGGWSGVTRIVLNPNTPQAKQKAVFLKIQQNHFYIAPNTGFRKRLTFEREFAAMTALRPRCPAIPEVLMFAKWTNDGNCGAILVTEALDGWHLLRDWQLGKASFPKPDQSTLKRALEAIAATSRQLNQAGWIHMCYSAKHIFIRPQDNSDEFDVRVIDLEKTRKRFGLGRRTVKDSSHFLRHTPKLSETDKLNYLKAYFKTDSFSNAQQKLIRQMRGAPKV